MENIVLYLAITTVMCAIVFLIAIVAWMWYIIRTDKHEECIQCGRILKKCKDKYYIGGAGQLCKDCYKLIYK